ncbi:MAG: efflux RND transporter periplasmic adaptor subunit [Planctomycetaceae bacterium]|nr:MAG: efflux RND transporter periplasmic adaptor subunit [Planctomycetaceae bacterium]
MFFLLVLISAADGPGGTAPEVIEVSVLVNLLDQAVVPAREAGTLVEIPVREGVRVREGDVLARIDDTEAQLLLQRAQGELEVAAKNAANDTAVWTAETTRKITHEIFQRTHEGAQRFKGSISQSDLDRLRLDAETAEWALRQARHDLEIASLTKQLKQNEVDFAVQRVERRQITAPLSGMVVEISRRRGEWVQSGQEVVRIVRLDRLQAEGFFDVRQARGLVGRRVTLHTDDDANQRYSGQIVFVSPEVDPINRQVRVLAEIENPDLTLQPGMQGTIRIESSGHVSDPEEP